MTLYGLINTTDDSKVPLHSIDVKASVQGLIANVQTELLYENQGDEVIEASFVFPIDDNSAVHKFEAVVDGRLIVGECQGKEEARQTYADAMAAGETAFLMEEDDSSGDVFECKVGNLPPKTTAKVIFTFVTSCKVEDKSKGVTTFVYPCVLGPRYSVSGHADAGSNNVNQSLTSDSQPSTSKGPSPKKSKKTASYTSVQDLPYTFSAVINYFCKPPSKVTAMVTNCASTFILNDTYGQLKVSNFELDQDLEVHIHCTESRKPMLYVEKGDDTRDGLLKEDVVMLQFHPSVSEHVKKPNTRGEYIFVIDRSGSMMGDRITHAKKALKTCLEMLPQDCYFNIVSFGSQHSALFKSKLVGRSIKNSKDKLTEAISHAEGMYADMGGTEMVKPFKWIYDGKVISNYPKQIILLTDGAVWGQEMQSFFNMAKSNRKYARVFTFGIGFGASTALVRGLARAGNGRCDFIKEDMHKMKKQVSSLLHSAMTPAIQDVKLDVSTPDPVSHILIPTELPPVFLGEHFITYGILKGEIPKKESTITYTLTGVFEGKRLKYKLEVNLRKIEAETFEAKDMPIHRLAAKAQIKELQDDENHNGEKKNEILLVSTAANIMSRYTSFVGVDKGRVEKIKGKAKRVDIPIAKLTEQKERDNRKKKMLMSGSVGPRLVGGGTTGVIPAPRLYGGAGPDAPEAEKYLGGKVPDIPGIKDLVNTKVNSVSELKELSTLQCETTDDHTDNTIKHEIARSEEKQRKRKIKSGLKFTVKKMKKNLKVSTSMFGLWNDGYYYIGNIIKSDNCNPRKDRVHVQMKFKDGAVNIVHKNDILQAKVLSPGDIVSVHNGRENYIWGMVLEYTAKTDTFLVAFGSGDIINCPVKDIVIPHETALKMKDRKEFESDPKSLIRFMGIDGFLREITTSDVAELNTKGWINEPVVSYWISKILPETVKSDLLASSYIFSPRFFLTLTDSLQMSEDFLGFPAELQSIIIERQWRSFILRSDKWRGSKGFEAESLLNGVDITEKEVLFFPMFEEIHWYVIMVQVERDQLDKTAYRANFFTMDSYFKSRRDYEVTIIKRFLVETFAKQDKRLMCKDGVYQFHVPIQGNDWDCGSCMLQCINQSYEENLKPKPHLWWFYLEDLVEKRKEIAKDILDMWDIQKHTN